MNALEKFETCKHNDGYWCYGSGNRFLGFLWRLRHNVGINGFSIECHCKKCKNYEKKEKNID